MVLLSNLKRDTDLGRDSLQEPPQQSSVVSGIAGFHALGWSAEAGSHALLVLSTHPYLSYLCLQVPVLIPSPIEGES